MKNRQSLFAYILLAVFIIGGLAYFFAPFPPGKKAVDAVSSTPPSTAGFVKEGEIVFLRNGQKIKKIDVEIAENEAEQSKGLMYRPYLPDSAGMLFIFNDSAPRNFWMKNTIIPLDIMYVDAGKKIISIAKNTKPYSEESVPSLGNAQYVVEVNAGFSERHDIKTGDAISF
ncbi:hypothetical protein DYBT9275_04595 [Dyadobacter sp. CECT 9275]|uniref:DUF192 domain-containing protein n=1 Tax=Dyadobacter helix TaxID=2822344 RepID=A0A916N6H2_9BACT|nr:DUF192 domain-containing protein [Dyadobacter sp. CECT 9275]CAG5009909.1 hypothetical protein DYBT9275_04595 [Dyadobacter sp. CECT 9275]